MRYYLIAGEASGDLHASRLMRALKRQDPQAEFRFFGGDLMKAEGGHCVKHYRELAYMGIVPVLLHLPAILSGMAHCKRDISQWQPDVVILIDYPGFNLGMAKYVKTRRICPVYYYISPKIWAWKEYRIRDIRRYVDELFSILPFEVPFFEEKHHYPIHYVGNPTVEEVAHFKATWPARRAAFYEQNDLPSDRPLLALLAGSRRQEIKDNLPAMLQVADELSADYTVVVAGGAPGPPHHRPDYTVGGAGAPPIDRDYYARFMGGHCARVVYGQTYGLLCEAHAALVTSGTATLETALFRVPQVVCYETPLPAIIGRLRRHVLKVKYISLVNLIADREVVTELVADTFTLANIRTELRRILSGPSRAAMLQGYDEVARRLGDDCAPENAARIMRQLLDKSRQNP